MQFTDDEIETIKDLLRDHGSDYGLQTDSSKHNKLGAKLGLWEADPDPTPEELAEQERKRKEFAETPMGKIMTEMFKRSNEAFARDFKLFGDDIEYYNGVQIGTDLKIKLPNDYSLKDNKNE